MRVLLFYFEPFGSDALNASQEAANLISSRIAGAEIVKHRLPVSFARCPHEAVAAVDSLLPDLIICLGQAAGRASINLERLAINIANAANPDSDGDKPSNRKLNQAGPDACMSKIPVDLLAKNIREKNCHALSQTQPAHMSVIVYTIIFCNAFPNFLRCSFICR